MNRRGRRIRQRSRSRLLLLAPTLTILFFASLASLMLSMAAVVKAGDGNGGGKYTRLELSGEMLIDC